VGRLPNSKLNISRGSINPLKKLPFPKNIKKPPYFHAGLRLSKKPPYFISAY
jgi:hypothetical protein